MNGGGLIPVQSGLKLCFVYVFKTSCLRDWRHSMYPEYVTLERLASQYVIPSMLLLRGWRHSMLSGVCYS